MELIPLIRDRELIHDFGHLDSRSILQLSRIMQAFFNPICKLELDRGAGAGRSDAQSSVFRTSGEFQRRVCLALDRSV